MGDKLELKKGDLKQGLDNIEQYLNLDKASSLFINEYYSSSNCFPDLAEPSDWVAGDISASLAPVIMAGDQASLVTLSCPNKLKEYLTREGFISRDAKIISLCDDVDIKGRLFPESSVIVKMKEKLKKRETNGLENKTLIPSFTSSDAEAVAELIDGKTLVKQQDSINANSKSYLRKLSEEKEFNMPEGLIAPANQDISLAIKAFNNKAISKNINTDLIWLKLPTVAGGGTIPLKNGISEKIVKDNVLEFIQQAKDGYKDLDGLDELDSYEDIPQNMLRDLVFEFNINADGNSKILDNYCIQAVVGKKDITYVGTTGQVTEDGDYMGGRTINENEEAMIETILPEVTKVYKALQEKGYKGFAGVDVILVDNAGTIEPYIMEVNSRFNASTPLISIAQKIEEQKEEKIYGEILSLPVPVKEGDSEEVMDNILRAFNDAGILYNKEKLEGVIPFMPDVYPGRENLNIAKTRCAVIADTPQEAKIIKNKIEKLVLN